MKIAFIFFGFNPLKNMHECLYVCVSEKITGNKNLEKTYKFGIFLNNMCRPQIESVDPWKLFSFYMST